MRGPIDYIAVGFEGKKFDGSILNALVDPIEKGIIKLVALAGVSRDENDVVTFIDINQMGDQLFVDVASKYVSQNDLLSEEDLNEVADLIEKNCTAGILVVEQLWAKPLKEALIKDNGVLLAEGRIHPEAALELDKEDK